MYKNPKQNEFDEFRENEKKILSLIYQSDYVDSIKTYHAIGEIKRRSKELKIEDNYQIKKAIKSLDTMSKYWKTLVQGDKGELKVFKALALLNKPYKLLQNVQLECEGQVIEIDDLVINDYGIFILEVKNYKKSMVVLENGLFKRENEKDKQSYNAYTKLLEKKTVLEHVIKDNINLDNNLHIRTILVNANDDCYIDNQCSKVDILYTSETLDYINSLNEKNLTCDEQTEISNTILSKLSNRQFKTNINYDEILKNVEEAINVIENTKPIGNESRYICNEIPWNFDIKSCFIGASITFVCGCAYKLIKEKAFC